MALGHLTRSEMDHHVCSRQKYSFSRFNNLRSNMPEGRRQSVLPGNKYSRHMPEFLKENIKAKSNTSLSQYLQNTHKKLIDEGSKAASHTWHCGILYKFNSSYMSRVNETTRAITSLLNATVDAGIFNDRNRFTVALGKINDAYNEAIQATHTYIYNRRHAETRSGIERLNMVKSLRDLLMKEQTFFSTAAWRVFKERPYQKNNAGEKLWLDILYTARAEEIDLEDGRGGATCSIKKYKDKKTKKTRFYKDGDTILHEDFEDELFLFAYKSKVYDIDSIKKGKKGIQEYSRQEQCDIQWLLKYRMLVRCEDYYGFSFVEDFCNGINNLNFYLEQGALDKVPYKLVELHRICRLNDSTIPEKIRNELKDLIDLMYPQEYEDVYSSKEKTLEFEKRNLSQEDKDKCEKEAREYVNLSRQIISGYRHLHGLAETTGLAKGNHIKPGTELYLRNVATSRMADLLFPEKYKEKPLVARSKTLVRQDGNHYFHGNSMEAAEGKGCAEIKKLMKEQNIPEENVSIDPSVMQRITDLMVMDYLVGQMDRHGSNFLMTYSIKEENNTKQLIITGITGIDNDMSFTDFKPAELKGRGRNRLQDIHNIKVLTKELVNTIKHLNPANIKYLLADLGLRKEEFDAMELRLAEIQDYISHPRENNLMILESTSPLWSKVSLENIDPLPTRPKASCGKAKREEYLNRCKRGVAHTIRLHFGFNEGASISDLANWDNMRNIHTYQGSLPA